MCSTASGFQDGGGKATKKGASKKKVDTKKNNSATKSDNNTPTKTTAAPPTGPARPVETRIRPPAPSAPAVQVFGPGLSIDLGNNVKLELVLIRAGSFTMGSTNGDADEKPVHQVTISQAFYIGRYEVTQAQWQSVMGSNPSYFRDCGGNCPLEQVSWNDAQNFINKLNENNDGFGYRLPTEGEWEYACRAGTTGEYAGDLDSMAWYSANSGGKTHLVGTKQPNGFGLYDMHGNVWEWCEDWYHPSYDGAPGDGSAWLSGGDQWHPRVLRGGSWSPFAPYLRSAGRYYPAYYTPDFRYNYVGFRVVAVVRTQ